jgi:hypothetical protein
VKKKSCESCWFESECLCSVQARRVCLSIEEEKRRIYMSFDSQKERKEEEERTNTRLTRNTIVIGLFFYFFLSFSKKQNTHTSCEIHAFESICPKRRSFLFRTLRADDEIISSHFIILLFFLFLSSPVNAIQVGMYGISSMTSSTGILL